VRVVAVYYPGDPAAKGAAEVLEREYGIKAIELPTDAPFADLESFEADSIIVLSRHSSEKKVKAFTAHHTGNFGEARLGGEPGKLAYAHPSLSCSLIKALNEFGREGYDVTYEATHHGPTPDKPLVFVEIGSSEEEWKDPKNHEVLAKAVASWEDFACSGEPAIWIGGPHYAKRATKRCLEDEARFGHIAAKYAVDSLNEELLRQMVERSVERPEVAYVEKKSAKSSKRRELISVLESLGLKVKVV
jgi:D-aminoacyl-tRNA deacylase